MTTQPDLFSPPVAPPPGGCKNPESVSSPSDLRSRQQENLRAHLGYYKTFRTRAQICESLGWTERQLRDVAESLGADIVRCQAGFKLTADIQREELGIALQASDSFLSQGKRMIRYALSLRKNLHHLIG